MFQTDMIPLKTQITKLSVISTSPKIKGKHWFDWINITPFFVPTAEFKLDGFLAGERIWKAASYSQVFAPMEQAQIEVHWSVGGWSLVKGIGKTIISAIKDGNVKMRLKGDVLFPPFPFGHSIDITKTVKIWR